MAGADRLIEIFNEAKTRPPGAERDEFLAESCGEDAELKEQVFSLLAAHSGAGDFLKAGPELSPEIEAELARLKPEEVGERIGRYKLREQIGEGGFGVVWVAEQQEPVRRTVALKIIKMGMDTREVVARFEQERQALAMMDHPSIARVFDAGATEHGRPFFVMELVRGIKITDYCDQANLPTEERLALFIQVCHAVQHAHQKGIIHRDLKPSNILVTLHDGVPVPKVIDFGVAKATQGRLGDFSIYTQFQQMIGTPLYMSPEQAEMSGLDVDTRTDIYALGVLLYELLTGCTPFDADALKKAGYDEMRRIIREQEPARPSTRLSTMLAADLTIVARHRHAEPGRLGTLLRGDLDWIVMRTLEKDRSRRYETASALAMDLQRHLNNEPVVACPPSRSYRFEKLVRRNKFVFVAVGAVLLALIGGLAVSIWLFIRETRAHEQTFIAEQKQERSRELAEENRQLSEARLYAADMNLTEQALAAGNVSRARDLLNAHRPQSGLPDFRGFEWRYFWKQCQSGQEATLRGHVGEVSGLSFSPDGQTLVTCGADRLLRLWDLRTKLEIAVLRGHTNWPNSAIFSRDGRMIASTCDDGTTKLWDVASRTEIATLTGHVGKVFDSSFSRDGTLATCGEDGTVRLWDVTSRRETAVLRHNAALLSCDFSRDGTMLATGGQDRRVTLWDVASHRTIGVLLGHDHEVQRMTFSPDGKTLATASEGESIRLWDVASRQEIAVFKSDTARFTYVCFSPNGKWIAASSRDGTIKLWDIASGALITSLQGHAAGIWIVNFSPDGQTLASGGMDAAVKIWDLSPKKEVDWFDGNTNLIWYAFFDAPGNKLATWESETLDTPATALCLWDTQAQGHTALDVAKQSIVGLAPAPDRTKLVTWGTDSQIRIWNLHSNSVGASFKSPMAVVNGAAFSPTKNMLFLWGTDASIKIVDAETGHVADSLPATEDQATGVSAVRISPDGKILASVGYRERRVKLWDLASLREIASLPVPGLWITALAFSPDSQSLAVGNQDSTITLWNVNSRQELAVFQGHASRVTSLAFSPDNRNLATGSMDNTVRLWNCVTRNQVATLRGHPRGVSSVDFSPDGQTLATASGEKGVRLWRASSFRETDSLPERK